VLIQKAASDVIAKLGNSKVHHTLHIRQQLRLFRSKITLDALKVRRLEQLGHGSKEGPQRLGNKTEHIVVVAQMQARVLLTERSGDGRGVSAEGYEV
jgi:hypothetical protein